MRVEVEKSEFLRLADAIYTNESVYYQDKVWEIAHRGDLEDMLEALMLTIPVAESYREARTLMADKIVGLTGMERARVLLRGLAVSVTAFGN